jgi:hypothetical protein
VRTTGRVLARGAAVVVAIALAVPAAASADSTPVGKLPRPAVTTVTTGKGSLVSITLPAQRTSTGLVWRVARPIDTRIVRQVGEADAGPAVVLVFRTVGRGAAAITVALTRGDASPRAIRAVRYAIRVT